ncbi:hypothetical protein BC332_29015 [Capsicum chinense]|nr:hypothetical protein BC332_29014 [Capsicum chinense]PHU03764.1 hypothetical protein BC332_29015 [Capsicum chinense]
MTTTTTTTTNHVDQQCQQHDVVVVVVPTAQGHLHASLELSRCLSATYNIPFTMSAQQLTSVKLSRVLMLLFAYCIFISYVYDAAKPPVPPEAEVVLKQLPPLDGCHSPEMEEFAQKQVNARVPGGGNIYSTSRVIDELYLDLLEKMNASKDFKHWAVGPFNPVEIETTITVNRHYSLEWLDKQPPNSVLFVDADKGDIFSGEVRKCQLPEGYEKRVSERGLVMRDWAPQLEILAHPSTGGFMSHCGWNSCMESISMGVPIVAWPMHSDQPRNALFIAEGLKIGILMREWERRNEVVSAETIERVVRTLMASPEGEEMKRKATALKEAVKLSVMEGGVTQKETQSFVAHITR